MRPLNSLGQVEYYLGHTPTMPFSSNFFLLQINEVGEALLQPGLGITQGEKNFDIIRLNFHDLTNDLRHLVGGKPSFI
jgi:hypothetical protein